MKFRNTILTLSALALMVSCGSSKKKERELEERENEDIQRDYVVVDASSTYRPGWVEDAEVWAGETEGHDTKTNRYFSFETEPKSSRTVACKLAKTQVNLNIAGEISTFIDRTLATTLEGDASVDSNNPQVKALQQYVEESLVEKVVAEINGASTIKLYWEKRQYKESLGAKKDYQAFVCSTLVRMDSKNLARAVERAGTLVTDQASGNLKARVKEALKDANEKFETKN